MLLYFGKFCREICEVESHGGGKKKKKKSFLIKELSREVICWTGKENKNKEATAQTRKCAAVTVVVAIVATTIKISNTKSLKNKSRLPIH